MYNYNAEKGSYRVLTSNVCWHLSSLLIKRNYVRDEFVCFYKLINRIYLLFLSRNVKYFDLFVLDYGINWKKSI